MPSHRSLAAQAKRVAVDRRVVERAVRRTQRWWNFRGDYEFVDRRRGSDRLVTVLAGYKPHLWHLTLARFQRFLPADADVCIVAPAIQPAPLLELARSAGWSFLSSEANSTSLAQNLAIRAHPAARWIYKLDEDIFIAERYCEGLLDAYQRIEAEGSYRPGFAAPLLNVNGFSYIEFLRALGLLDDYRAQFGEWRHAAAGVRVAEEGAAARWIWERSVPFDEVAKRIAGRPFAYSTVPHRFSIGAILFERDFWWEEMGGFRVRPPEGSLGIDEAHICRVCVDASRVMTVAHNVAAGHFSFGAQDEAMRQILPHLEAGLLPPQVGPEVTVPAVDPRASEAAPLR